MTTVDFITELFCRVADTIHETKHSQAKLYPSEVVTLALLFALRGCGQQAFWRWSVRDYQPLFPNLLSRTRLFRLFNSHHHCVDAFLAAPSMIGVIDAYGIELIQPVREGRSAGQRGKKGGCPWGANHRWIVGGKLCYVLNNLGLIVNRDCDTANVYDGSAFQQLVDNLADDMVVFSDTDFDKADWHPTNLRLCKRGEWHPEGSRRMVVETVLSMLTYICDFKHTRHKVWDYFQTKVGFTMALFNILVQWYGIHPNQDSIFPLSIADFSL